MTWAAHALGRVLSGHIRMVSGSRAVSDWIHFGERVAGGSVVDNDRLTGWVVLQGGF